MELTSAQKFDASGNVVPALGTRSEIVSTFNPDSGNLFIDYYSTTETGRGVGTEMISNSISNFGPKNVQSVSGRLGLTNLSIYNSNLATMSTVDAAINTPLGQSLSTLGYRNISVNGEILTATLPK